MTIDVAQLLLLVWATPSYRLLCTYWSATIYFSLDILRTGCFTSGAGVVRVACCTRLVRRKSVRPVEKIGYRPGAVVQAGGDFPQAGWHGLATMTMYTVIC